VTPYGDRGGALVAQGRGRALDTEALRPGAARPDAAARARRDRPGARAGARRRAARDARARNRSDPRTNRGGRGRAGELAATRPPYLPGPDGQIRLQWCAGAPGVVIGAADYLDEGLLLAGAELCWKAGPHGAEKGPSICHGTAGNGYALLAAFERTGDERWLERARRFAVHALDQARRERADRGRGRYSLWTGDLGVALYAASCLEARAAYPVLDPEGLG
jgi:hypothetical protein